MEVIGDVNTVVRSPEVMVWPAGHVVVVVYRYSAVYIVAFDGADAFFEECSQPWDGDP